MCRKLLVCVALVAVLGNQFLPSDASEQPSDRALFDAVHRSAIDQVKFSIENGADVNATDSGMDSVIHWAAAYGDLEIVQFLAERGANIEARNRLGLTPLAEAFTKSRYYGMETVDFLLSMGADINAADNDGLTILHNSVIDGRVKDVEYVITHKANVNAKTKNLLTPLHYAAFGEVEIVETLLSNKDIKLNEKTKYALMTPLDLAINFGNKNTVDLLTRKGAEKTANTDNLTPLHYAAMEGLDKVVRSTLMFKSVDPNVTTKRGFTPLHYAAMNGHTEIAEILLSSGADVGATTDAGLTPRDLAEIAGHTETEVRLSIWTRMKH